MALTTSTNRNTTALALVTNSASREVANVISEANRSNSSVDYANAQGSLASGNLRAEQLQYNPSNGNFNYTRVIFKKN